jgi:hypothetical protein
MRTCSYKRTTAFTPLALRRPRPPQGLALGRAALALAERIAHAFSLASAPREPFCRALSLVSGSTADGRAESRGWRGFGQ